VDEQHVNASIFYDINVSPGSRFTFLFKFCQRLRWQNKSPSVGRTNAK